MVSPRSIYVAWRRRTIYRRALSGPGRAVILRYHAVGRAEEIGEYLDPGLSVDPGEFRRQMELLSRRCEPIDLDRLAHRIRGGARSGRLAVAVTFDDGYRDNHDAALPILAEAGVPATFFVSSGPVTSRRGLWISELWRLVPRLPAGPTGLPAPLPPELADDPEQRRVLRRRITRWFAGLAEEEREARLDDLARRAGVPRGEGLEESFMSGDQLRALCAAGMSVGAHTRTHPHLDHLPPELHEEEVLGGRRDLEELIGEPVRHFAYPNPSGGGRFVEQARSSVAAAGFDTAVTSTPGPLGPASDPLRLPRLGVYRGAQSRLLFSLIEKACR